MENLRVKQSTFRKKCPIKRVLTYNPEVNYKSYRKHLKEDFEGRCGYCNSYHGIVKKDYHIDHFVPRKVFEKFPTHLHLDNDYGNLIYSCPSCNRSKSSKWLSEDPDIAIVNGAGFVNPCTEEYDKLFFRDENGAIYPVENNTVAEYIHQELSFSLTRHQIAWKIESLIDLVEKSNSGSQNNDPKDILVIELLAYLRKHFEMEIIPNDN